MDFSAVFSNLILGFTVAMSAQNLLYCFIGCLLGTLIGVLPGIGPVATIAMLLPATYALPPLAALIMLAGIYYGAQYGGVDYRHFGGAAGGNLGGGYCAGRPSNGA
jgi:TctA family transporter